MCVKYAAAAFAALRSGSETISISGVPARFRSMPVRFGSPVP
jgi:hypothetical protein